MDQQHAVFTCPICQTTVEVLQMCGMEFTCCGRAMEEQHAKTREFGREKHSPIVQQIDGGIRVHVGPLEHPMTERHHIQWIEVRSAGRVQRQYLEPGQPPMADFTVETDRITVQAYCSLHGLWKRSMPAFLPEYVLEEVEESRAS